jgi:hypothetical protein
MTSPEKHISIYDELKEYAWGERARILFVKWLKQKREELFINTVSTMDCEMSGIREETFDNLLEDLE